MKLNSTYLTNALIINIVDTTWFLVLGYLLEYGSETTRNKRTEAEHSRVWLLLVYKPSTLFSEGGTISNLYSILVARHHFYPEVKTRGMGALPQLALFTSAHVIKPNTLTSTL